METSQTARRHEASAGVATPVDEDVLFQAGEFVDAQLLLGEEDPQPQSQGAATRRPAALAESGTEARGGGPASSLSDMDSALASNLDSLLQADFESVEQVLTSPPTPTPAPTTPATPTTTTGGDANPMTTETRGVVHKGGGIETDDTKGGGTCLPPSHEGETVATADGQSLRLDALESAPSESACIHKGIAAPDDAAAIMREALSRPAAPPDAPAGPGATHASADPHAPHAPPAEEPGEARRGATTKSKLQAPPAPESASGSASGSALSPSGRTPLGLRSRAATLAVPAVAALHLINRPLMILPAKFHAAISVVSLSMLFWAAVVWCVVLFSPQHRGVLPLDERAGTEARGVLPLDERAGTEARGVLPLDERAGTEARGVLPLDERAGTEARGVTGDGHAASTSHAAETPAQAHAAAATAAPDEHH